MAGKFQIYQDAKGEFRFRLKASNGQTILQGTEGYSSKQSCQKGIESVRKNAADDARFERLKSKSEQPYFALKAANGEKIGLSEMYSSTSSMNKGIESVKKNAPDAALDDQTLAK